MKKAMEMVAAVALAAVAVWPAQARVETRGVICRAELDRAVLLAGGRQTAVVKITLDAPEAPRETERPPVNLVIVLDRSGSMHGDKIEKAKEAAIEALRRLGPRDLFSLVIYDHNVETLVPAQSAANTEWIESRIRQIHPGGNTALFGGVSQGAAEVRKNIEGRYVHRIILLSDGLANVGPSSPSDLARLGTSLLKEKISVTTVGVGTDYNEDLMTQLAQRSDGNTYFVESSGDLPRIFAAELGDVLSVVARRVILEIECEDGARPIRIIGRDGRIRRNGVEIQLNQLYGGQEKYLLVEMDIPAGEPAEVKPVAVARCRYEDAITAREVSATARVTATFSKREEEVVQSANEGVQSEIVRNVAAEAKDRAVELWDAGKREEAVKELRDTRERLTTRGAFYNYDVSGEALMEADKLEVEASALKSEGMSAPRRKVFRASSYQIRTQQESR